MKIGRLGQADRFRYGEHEPVERATPGQGGFAQELLRQQEQQTAAHLEQLLGEITASGQRLGQTPTYRELKAYRELVRQFIAEVVRRMYVLKTYVGWDRQGRRRVFALIRQVDGELAQLTELVRQGEQNRLVVLDKLDVIRGLLVDLYT